MTKRSSRRPSFRENPQGWKGFMTWSGEGSFRAGGLNRTKSSKVGLHAPSPLQDETFPRRSCRGDHGDMIINKGGTANSVLIAL